jgi:hypothetical protein
MEPESLLSLRERIDKFLIFPIEEGILPVKSLLVKSRKLRDCSDPISGGIKPESLLFERKRTNRCFRVPIEDGIKPVKLFSQRYRKLRLVNNPISIGIFPVK